MPRPLSFTVEGAWPSAQLTALSAVAFEEAVVDQLATPVAKVSFLQRKRPHCGGLGECYIQPMGWRIFQALVFLAVFWSNIEWRWVENDNKYVVALFGIAAAFAATVAVTWIKDRVTIFRQRGRTIDPSEELIARRDDWR